VILALRLPFEGSAARILQGSLQGEPCRLTF
jgi:hypothetical protein